MDPVDTDTIVDEYESVSGHSGYEMPASSWHEYYVPKIQGRSEIHKASSGNGRGHVTANESQSPTIFKHNVNDGEIDIVDSNSSLRNTPPSEDCRHSDPKAAEVPNEPGLHSFFSTSTISSKRSELLRSSRDWISQRLSWRMSGTGASPSNSFDDKIHVGKRNRQESREIPSKRIRTRPISFNPLHYFKPRKVSTMSKPSLFRRNFQHRGKEEPPEEPTQLSGNVAPVRPERPPRHLCPDVSTESLTSNTTHHHIRPRSDIQSIRSSDTPIFYNRWMPLNLGLGSIVQRARSKGNNSEVQSPHTEQKSFVSSLDLARVTRDAGTTSDSAHATIPGAGNTMRTHGPTLDQARKTGPDVAITHRFDTSSTFALHPPANQSLADDRRESYVLSDRPVTMCSDDFWGQSPNPTEMPDTNIDQFSKSHQRFNSEPAPCQVIRGGFFPNDALIHERYVKQMLQPYTCNAAREGFHECEKSTVETDSTRADITARYYPQHGFEPQSTTHQQQLLKFMLPPPLDVPEIRHHIHVQPSFRRERQLAKDNDLYEPPTSRNHIEQPQFFSCRTRDYPSEVARPSAIHDQRHSSSTISTPRAPNRIFTAPTYLFGIDAASIYTDVSVAESEPLGNNTVISPEDHAMNATDETMKELLALLDSGEQCSGSGTALGQEPTLRRLSDPRRKGVIIDAPARLPSPVQGDICIDRPQHTMIPGPAQDLRRSVLIESVTNVTGQGRPRRYINPQSKGSDVASHITDLHAGLSEPSLWSRSQSRLTRTRTIRRHPVGAQIQTEHMTNDTSNESPLYRGYQPDRSRAIDLPITVSPALFLPARRFSPLAPTTSPHREAGGHLSQHPTDTDGLAAETFVDLRPNLRSHMQSTEISAPPFSSAGQAAVAQSTAVPDFPLYLAALRDRRAKRADHTLTNLSNNADVPFAATGAAQSQVKDKDTQAGSEVQDDGPANISPGAWAKGKYAANNEFASLHRMGKLKRRSGMDFTDNNQDDNGATANMF